MSLAAPTFAEVDLNGGGATFPNPIYQKWVQAYQVEHPDVRINYQSQGSGFGIKGITDGTLDFAGSDAPMSDKEKRAAGGTIVQIPSVAGSVVPAYNLPGFKGELKLTGQTIADIYMGRVTTWNDKGIAASNPGVNLPGTRITPVYRTDGSGTSFVFTSYLSTQSPTFKDKVGAGKSVDFPVGQGGKGNPGVAAAVSSTPGAIGYIELNYAVENDIAFAAVKNKDGKFVKASPDVGLGRRRRARVQSMKAGDMAVDLWDQSGADAYPISAFTYLIVKKDLSYLKDKQKAQALVGYLEWATTDGQAMAGEMNYAPLSQGVRDKAAETIGMLEYDGQKLDGGAMKMMK